MSASPAVCAGRTVPEFGAATLERALAPLVAPAGLVALAVAISGGADSAALLSAVVALGRAQPRFRVRALHVDHGLVAAAALATAARAAAAALEVPLAILTVRVASGDGQSLEEAARIARRAALAAALEVGECLLTAHHLEDQAETLLLQLLRGAGPRGLSAMPAAGPLGRGRQLRPLLAVPRAALRAHARAHALPWHEDPMNDDPRFDRAYLRSALWPALVARWPAAAATLARSASHVAAAQRLLDLDSAERLAGLLCGPALPAAALAAEPRLRRMELLRYWLRSRGLRPPPTRRLQGVERELLRARPDATPRVAWKGGELRRFAGLLYAFAPLPPLPLMPGTPLPAAPGLVELGGLGRIAVLGGRRAAVDLGAVRGPLTLGPRQGGERLRVAPQGPGRPLKDWLREARLPPWARARAVLVRDQEQLVAVVLPHATLVAAECRAAAGTTGISLEWQDAPDVMAPALFVERGPPFG